MNKLKTGLVLVLALPLLAAGCGKKADVATITPVATDTSKSYTMAEVTVNNSATKCWTVINGQVYDLTTWISQHPGGEKGILSICGKDGTKAFEGQHGGQAQPMDALAKFKLGSLKQ
jgi:cytochrome b involved in lipid metabolism